MRIGVNGLFLGQRTTGSGQYTENLLRELLRLDTGDQYVLFYPSFQGSASSKQLKAASRGFDEHVLATPFDNRNRRLAKLWFEQVSFPRACRHLDLAHVPYLASPLFPTVPTVVTVHDLIPLILPAYRGSPLVRLYTRLVAAAARKAQAIITVSQESERVIVR